MTAHESARGELSCPICANPVPVEEAVACARCSSPHHEDCWEFAGGCSRFACGEKQWVHYRCIPRDLVSGRLELEDRHVLPAQYRGEVIKGLVRHRAAAVSRAVATGLLGGAGAVVTMFLQQGAAPLDMVFMFLAMGLGFGLVAPFLAPLQVRRPGRSTLTASLGVFVLFLLGERMRNAPVNAILALIAGIGVTSIIAGASLSEWVLGRRRALGIRLGPAATPLRYLVTALGSSGAILLSLFLSKSGFETRWIMETAPFALAAVLAAGYPLEKAKDALLSASPTEERPRLGPVLR